ncbi:MAG: 3'-5' exoribonuclease YhaM family protein [bacterium JZ-2024 1]
MEMRKPGANVSGTAVIHFSESRRTREGKNYLALVLADRTGAIPAKRWDPLPDEMKFARKGKVVAYSGQVREYQGALEVNLTRLEEVPEDRIVLSDYFPATERPPADIVQDIEVFLKENLKRAPLRDLCQKVLERHRKTLLSAPAAKKFHHAVVGGLAEHILSLLRLAQLVCQHYTFLDADLVYTGLFLHDIGKTLELGVTSQIDFTPEGRLLGHIYLGASEADAVMTSLKDFPPDLRLQVLHIILSHHGTYEFGSPVLPMTMEALVVHMLDDLDAKLWAIRDHIQRTPVENLPFTDFHRLLERYFYYSGRLEEDEASSAAV